MGAAARAAVKRNAVRRIFWAYRLEFSSSIRQLVGLGGLFCQLNVQNKVALLERSKPAKMLCTGHREFGQTDVSFCQSKMLYILDNVIFVCL